MFVKKNLELQRKIYATTIIRNMIKIFNGKILFILSVNKVLCTRYISRHSPPMNFIPHPMYLSVYHFFKASLLHTL